MDPIAQGQAGEVTPDPAASVEGQPEVQAQDGIQKRFDEMTARFRDAERQAAAKDAVIEQLLAQVQQRSAQPAAPVAPTLPEGVDPDELRKYEAIVGHVMGSKLKAIEAQMQQFGAQFGQTQFQMAAQKVGDPEVVKEAETLMASWRRAGLQGWNPEDALVYAAGKRALSKQQAQAGADAQRQAFNAAGQPITSHRATVTQNPEPQLPANYDRLSDIEKARAMAAFYEKRSAGKPF